MMYHTVLTLNGGYGETATSLGLICSQLHFGSKCVMYREEAMNLSTLTFLHDELLCLPPSRATVERVFSTTNRNQTHLRSRLSSHTLSNIHHTKRFLASDFCYNFEVRVTREVLDSMNSDIRKNVVTTLMLFLVVTVMILIDVKVKCLRLRNTHS